MKALEAKGLPYAYLAFEGEQHGFRKAENIVRALQAELSFYGAVLGFTPADQLPPLRDPQRESGSKPPKPRSVGDRGAATGRANRRAKHDTTTAWRNRSPAGASRTCA